MPKTDFLIQQNLLYLNPEYDNIYKNKL